jgi:putative ABC transport system ATP-binding protein
VHRPGIVLADEPTGNLDLETATDAISLLDRLCRDAGTTLVMATHSREVIGLADRVLTIRGGRLFEERP